MKKSDPYGKLISYEFFSCLKYLSCPANVCWSYLKQKEGLEYSDELFWSKQTLENARSLLLTVLRIRPT